MTKSQTISALDVIIVKIYSEEFFMPKNEGNIDRLLRVIIGLVLISLVFIGPKAAWGWVGLLPLLTGIIGFCPAYKIFGINTCGLKK